MEVLHGVVVDGNPNKGREHDGADLSGSVTPGLCLSQRCSFQLR